MPKGDASKVEMLGKKFGMLTVLLEYGRNRSGVITYLCECDCGNKKVIDGSSLRRSTKSTKSCGCLSAISVRTSFYPDMDKEDRLYYINSINRYRLFYGIDEDGLRALLDKQKGCCAICGDSLDLRNKHALDHCHETGEIRGYLCRLCNVGLGSFRDSAELLKKASEYLKEKEISYGII